MTCEYDYHHTIYDLATIYDLYVPFVRPATPLPAVSVSREQGAAAVRLHNSTVRDLASVTPFGCSLLHALSGVPS